MPEIETPERMDPATVESYFKLGFPAGFTLLDAPHARMTIDPTREEIRLETPALGSTPEVTAYEHLGVGVIERSGERWFDLRVDATDSRYEAYILIVSIVDQMRSGASVRHAVSEALTALKDLLKSRQRLTEEKVAGLIGELLVFNHVHNVLGEDAAMASWLGPLAEQHDFGLPEFDAEVKTTKSDSRVHVIGSETQLAPVPERPLYLISVQITRAGAASGGFSLPDLVASTRAKLDRSRRAFDPALESLGWRDEDADLYSTKFVVRSTPRAFLVGEDFPAITPARLDSVVPQRPLVTGVSYRVDVSQLPFSAAPSPLDTLCEEPT